MAKGTNPRLPYYKSKLEEEGIKAEYHFLGEENSGWIKNFVQSFIYSFKIALGNRVDCFYIYGPNALFLPIYIAAKLRGTRIIVEKTELDSIRPDRGLKDQLVKLSYKIDELIAPSMADGFVVITPKLEEYYGTKTRNIIVCPSFVDPERFSGIDVVQDKNKISYLGTFGSKDNVDGIIEAFEIAKKSLPNLELQLLGNGQLAFDEIPQKLLESSLLISNRNNSPYALYGSPTKLLEYLASGVPVIATTTKNQLLFLKDGVNYVYTNANDVDQLASKIVDRFKNGDIHDKIGQVGRETVVLEHSIDTILNQWLNFFNKINKNVQ